MKLLPFTPVAILLLSIAACSSGGSSTPAPQSSANNEPADTNTAANEQSSPEVNPANESNTENGVVLADPQSGVGQLQTRIQTLTGSAISQLNTSLNQGEMLSTQENQCIGAFDPALGEPLLSVNCEQPLALDNVAIYLTLASLEDSPACRSSLQNNNADNCNVVQANLIITTLWQIPEVAEGQPERPQPKAGALIDYSTESGRLSIENLPAALAGVFNCEYDLNTGNSVDANVSSGCTQQVERIVELIDDHLVN